MEPRIERVRRLALAHAVKSASTLDGSLGGDLPAKPAAQAFAPGLMTLGLGVTLPLGLDPARNRAAVNAGGAIDSRVDKGVRGRITFPLGA